MKIIKFTIVSLLLFVFSTSAQNSYEHLFDNKIDIHEFDEIPSLFELTKNEYFSIFSPHIPDIHFNKALTTRQFFYKDSFTGQFKLYETQGDGSYLKYKTFDYFSLPLGCGLTGPQGGASPGDFSGAIFHALLREIDLGFKLGRHTITFF
jgi:hypothetical protein